MKHSLIAVLFAAGAVLMARAPQIGDIIWKKPDFSGRSAANYAVVKDRVLTIKAGESAASKDKQLQSRDLFGRETKAQVRTNYTIAFSLGEHYFRNYLGYLVEFSVDVKGDVPVPNCPWSGIRIAINYSVDGEPFVYSYNGLSGKFDWKRITLLTRIPYDLRDASLNLGILGKSGFVQFRNPVITIKELPRCNYYPENPPPMHKGHNFPRLRGFNSAWPTLRWYPDMLNVRNKWGANVITGTFRPGIKILKGKELDAYLQKAVYDLFDNTEKIAADAGMYYILQMADDFKVLTPPLQSDLFYHKPEYADYMVDVWTRIAKHYKGCKYIYGFQLLNESCFRVTKQPGCPDYEEMMERVAQAINKVDPGRTIIIQPEEWWGMRAFDKMRPIKAKNIVYAPHIYAPMVFSHQGIGGQGPQKYPGMINGRWWDKETLRKTLRPGVEFQKQYNVHMLVTEFSVSAITDAQSRENWARDLIELFEEYGWDWTWHAINEFTGWAPHAVISDFYRLDRWNRGESYKFVKETPTSKVIKYWMAKNKHPARIPLKNADQYRQPKKKTAARPVSKPVIDYPVEKVTGSYYVTSKNGMNFSETKYCHVAKWKIAGNPVIEGGFSLNKLEWTPFTSEFKVTGNGSSLFVFNPPSVNNKTTWLSLKDLKVVINGKEYKCKWHLGGYRYQDKTGKTYFVISRSRHVFAVLELKDGDRVNVTGLAKRTTKEDIR